MSYKNNSSRYMSYGAKESAFYEYEHLKRTPTSKQRKFHAALCRECRKNGLDPIEPDNDTRVDFAEAIDKMVDSLKSAGVVLPEKKTKFEPCYNIGAGYGQGVFVGQRLRPVGEEDNQWLNTNV